MLNQAAENLVNLTTLPSLNLVIKTYFALNKELAMADYLIVDFMMLMLGFVCLKTKMNENMTGLSMKMEPDLEGKLNSAKVIF